MSGLDFADDGRSAVPVDIDGDGDLDLVMQSLQGLRIVENRREPRHFARVHLRATTSDAQAIGARVTIKAGGMTQRRIVRLCDGFQSQVSLELHFGLGDAELIDELQVHWPSGATQRFEDLLVDRRLSIVEGVEEVATAKLPTWPESTRPGPAPAASLLAIAADLDGKRRPLAQSNSATAQAPATTQGTVVNFWAPWCQPCMQELPELAKAAKKAGDSTRFIGVSVEREDLDGVRASLAEHGVLYEQRLADDQLLSAFFGEAGAAALPTTFVFDGEGRLRRVYRRPIEARELQTILSSFQSENTFAYDLLRSAIAEIEAGDPQRAAKTLRRVIEADPTMAAAQFQLGRLWTLVNRHERAQTAFEKACKLEPRHGPAWFNLGVARLHLGQPDKAIRALMQALELSPEDVQVALALGSAHAQGGDLEKALTAFEIACARDGRSAIAHLSRGRALRDLGRTAEGRAAFSTALKLDPNLSAARQELDR